MQIEQSRLIANESSKPHTASRVENVQKRDEGKILQNQFFILSRTTVMNKQSTLRQMIQKGKPTTKASKLMAQEILLVNKCKNINTKCC
ncbi:hypothetical protein FGO68_gene13253 [Halteria grandinella]|uniref:Uncharacterized protein n=1 Tax=Halteria grandinella TaxID=5974 RepID=A0A8J8SY96_HALGN|nr:hypothetical protein FGO68_gene13253 [Halteria grandinella]